VKLLKILAMSQIIEWYVTGFKVPLFLEMYNY
jgi:hypothetical protein